MNPVKSVAAIYLCEFVFIRGYISLLLLCVLWLKIIRVNPRNPWLKSLRTLWLILSIAERLRRWYKYSQKGGLTA
jgi:hypothetical protein